MEISVDRYAPSTLLQTRKKQQKNVNASSESLKIEDANNYL